MTPRDDGLVRDRDGDLVPPNLLEPHRCDGGWLGDNDDHPVPCLICRPHLVPRSAAATSGALADRAAALQAELDAAGDLGTQALEAARQALGTRRDDTSVRVLTEAVRELHDLHVEPTAPARA